MQVTHFHHTSPPFCGGQQWPQAHEQPPIMLCCVLPAVHPLQALMTPTQFEACCSQQHNAVCVLSWRPWAACATTWLLHTRVGDSTACFQVTTTNHIHTHTLSFNVKTATHTIATQTASFVRPSPLKPRSRVGVQLLVFWQPHCGCLPHPHPPPSWNNP